eukprot:CAMPEP_0118671716 /NCGR_PEP_ID=MMETSP0785-20121206/22152_1 /TAXON_ID=91992 /ORGANISM="Bolidomonas pacifica, Strain CCMP 1866" /LENGTH=156 /DNA_ID=CAMNT_0006566623 /DNA_START=61 /DNA_END=527 /DNA_ORIENTATION=-
MYRFLASTAFSLTSLLSWLKLSFNPSQILLMRTLSSFTSFDPPNFMVHSKARMAEMEQADDAWCSMMGRSVDLLLFSISSLSPPPPMSLKKEASEFFTTLPQAPSVLFSARTIPVTRHSIKSILPSSPHVLSKSSTGSVQAKALAATKAPKIFMSS